MYMNQIPESSLFLCLLEFSSQIVVIHSYMCTHAGYMISNEDT